MFFVIGLYSRNSVASDKIWRTVSYKIIAALYYKRLHFIRVPVDFEFKWAPDTIAGLPKSYSTVCPEKDTKTVSAVTCSNSQQNQTIRG